MTTFFGIKKDLFDNNQLGNQNILRQPKTYSLGSSGGIQSGGIQNELKRRIWDEFLCVHCFELKDPYTCPFARCVQLGLLSLYISKFALRFHAREGWGKN